MLSLRASARPVATRQVAGKAASAPRPVRAVATAAKVKKNRFILVSRPAGPFY